MGSQSAGRRRHRLARLLGAAAGRPEAARAWRAAGSSRAVRSTISTGRCSSSSRAATGSSSSLTTGAMSVRAGGAPAWPSRLEALAHRTPNASGQPVRLVAHSMGGLVVRAMIADGGAGRPVAAHHAPAGQRLRDARHAQPRLLGGGALAHRPQLDPGQARPARHHPGHRPNRRVRVPTSPGCSNSCPAATDDPDFTEAQVVEEPAGRRAAGRAGTSRRPTAVAGQAAADLGHARARLRPSRGRDGMLYVAGCQAQPRWWASIAGPTTSPTSPAAARMALDSPATAGDGTVLWTSGPLPRCRPGTCTGDRPRRPVQQPRPCSPVTLT